MGGDQWKTVAQNEWAGIEGAYEGVGRAEWEKACEEAVSSGGGAIVSKEEKVDWLGTRLREFLPCVPEYHSRNAPDDEQGISQGTHAPFLGCLLPPTHSFSHALSKSLPTPSQDPPPYLEDLTRDLDLIAFLRKGRGANRERGFVKGLQSAKDMDWWAYAVMCDNGICPGQVE